MSYHDDHYVSDHSVIFNVSMFHRAAVVFHTHTHTHIYIYTHSYIYFETGKNMGFITCCRMFGLVANMVRTMQVAVPPVSFLVVNCSDTWPVCFVSSQLPAVPLDSTSNAFSSCHQSYNASFAPSWLEIKCSSQYGPSQKAALYSTI